MVFRSGTCDDDDPPPLVDPLQENLRASTFVAMFAFTLLGCPQGNRLHFLAAGKYSSSTELILNRSK
jgi:hypothetical protein